MFKTKKIPESIAIALLSVTSVTHAASTLEEVVVTATKRAENQQDVPVAISAMTADAMAERGLTETTDLSGAVPNLVVTSPFGRTQPNFAIRGISVANEYNANAASPIGMYINEDYKQFRPTHGMAFFDIERVEVIRGPQGTLFGRNTTGGAISVTTKAPSFNPEGEVTGYINTSYGNYDRKGIDAAVDTTLIEDVLAMRLAMTWNDGDGYLKNKTPDTIPTALSQAGVPDAVLTGSGLPTTKNVNALTDKNFGSVSDRAIRLTVDWVPTDNFDGRFIYTNGKSDPYGVLPMAHTVMNDGQTELFGYGRQGLDDDEVSTDTNGKFETDSDDFNVTLNFVLSDTLSMTTITGYQEGSYTIKTDCDGLPIESCVQNFDSDFDQFNQDIRFSWEGERAKAIFGIYYGEDSISSNDSKSFYTPLEDFGGLPAPLFDAIANDTSGAFPAALQAQAAGIYAALTAAGASTYPTFNPPIPGWFALGNFVGDPTNPLLTATGFKTSQSYTQERESKAVYFEGNYDVTDKATLTLGLRYTEDDFTLKDLRATIHDSNNVAQFDSIPLNATPNSGVSADQTGSSHEVTGRLIFDYQFTDDFLGFISYSRGYRAGTFNGSAYQTIAQADFVDPEFVNNIEVGFKSMLLDNTMQLNATYYYARYKDQQIQEAVGPTTFIRNASGVLQGLEAEAQWMATDDLFLSLGFGYIDSEYDNDQYFAGAGNAGADCQQASSLPAATVAAQCLNIGGNEFPFAPQFSANIYAEYVLGRWNDSELVVSSTARWQDDVWFDSLNDDKSNQVPGSTMSQEAYAVVDARLSYGNDDWKASFWVKNLEDKYYHVFGIDTAAAFGTDFLIRGEPRTYGLDFSYNF